MAVSSVKVTFDKQAVVARITIAKEKALGIVSNEMLKDANYYAREDTGELIRSSIKSSEPNNGILRWTTPYARMMYYVGNPSTDRNQNASLMWAHKAAAENKEKYRDLVKKIMKGS